MATAAYSVLCFLFRNQILRFLGASDNTIGFARDYMLWVLVIGGIPTVLSMTMANLIRSIGNAKEAGFGLTMGGLLNLALDPLFMFVILPDGQLVFIIPLLIILDTLFGMEGIVWTQFAGDFCTVIVTYLVYWKVYKKGLRLQQA